MNQTVVKSPVRAERRQCQNRLRSKAQCLPDHPFILAVHWRHKLALHRKAIGKNSKLRQKRQCLLQNPRTDKRIGVAAYRDCPRCVPAAHKVILGRGHVFCAACIPLRIAALTKKSLPNGKLVRINQLIIIDQLLRVSLQFLRDTVNRISCPHNIDIHSSSIPRYGLFSGRFYAEGAQNMPAARKAFYTPTFLQMSFRQHLSQ